MPDPQFDGRKLYHVRNVFLLSDGDNLYQVKEPIKWGDIDISTVWDAEVPGYKSEFTDGDVLLEFDLAAGKDIVDQQYEDKFAGMVVSLKFGELNSANVLTILYEGTIDFQTVIQGKYTTKASIDRKSFNDKFRTRVDTNTDILATQSIGGVVLDPLPLKELFLHPRLLTKTASFIYNENVDKIDIGLTVEISDGPGPNDPQWNTTVPPFWTGGDDGSGSNSIPGLSEPLAPDGELLYTGLTLEPGVTKRVLFFDVAMSFKFTMGNTSQNIRAGFSIFKRSNISGGTTALFPSIGPGTPGPFATAASVGYYENYGNVAGTKTMIGSAQGSLELVADEAVFIKAWVFTPGNALFVITNFDWINTNNHYLNINEQTITKASLARVPYIHEAVNRQLEIITDTIRPLKSNFLGRVELGYAADGCASKHVVASGLMIRNFKNRAFNMSSKSWITALMNIFCMGLTVERNNEGAEWIRFEPLAYFFRNVLLFRFNTISKWEKKPANQYIYNEQKWAFQKFPQDDQDSSLEDWMTEMQYIAPAIATVKNKLEKVINWILSGYYFEYTRVQSFLKKPTNTYETDADVFMASTTTGDEYLNKNITFDLANNQIVIMDIVALVDGEQFTIADAAGGVTAGTYTAVTVEIPYAYDRTIITVTGPLPSDGDGSGDVTVSADRIRVKRNEDFLVTYNVPNPKSAYNLEHHLKRIMIRWAIVFNAGYFKQFDQSGTQFVSGRNNTSVGTWLKDEVTCRYGSVREPYFDANPDMATNNLKLPLWKANIITFEAPITWTTLNLIRMAFEGRHPDGDDYGYFEWDNPKGITEKGFILSMGFNPVTQMLKCQMIEKYE